MYPTNASLPPDVTGRWWTNFAPIDMKLRYARWTLVDVYERLWMAPPAGFEIDRKLPSGKLSRMFAEHDTPGDTPHSFRCSLILFA